MDRRVGMLAGLLVLSLASGTVAQSPSPEPPPWFGEQRVEMSEHGFAVTVPDGWVALDPAGDVELQAWVMLTAFDPVSRDGEVGEVAEALQKARSEGIQLQLIDGSMASNCGLTVRAKRAIETGEFAEVFAAAMADDERYSDVEPPRVIELPAGPGFVISAGQRAPDELVPGLPGGFVPVAGYLVDSDKAVLFAVCVGPERPDDDWLSVIEGYEFLPVE